LVLLCPKPNAETFPRRFQVATERFSSRPPDLNLSELIPNAVNLKIIKFLKLCPFAPVRNQNFVGPVSRYELSPF
jgi:hypothetical protein